MNLIKVNNLNLSIYEKEILKGLCFEGKSGEILGIIGESGSGKSMTANSIIKLLPFGSSLTGDIIFQKSDPPEAAPYAPLMNPCLDISESFEKH